MEIHNLTARIIPERAYSVSEAARYLGVHRCTIYAYISHPQKPLPFTRQPNKTKLLFHGSDLIAYKTAGLPKKRTQAKKWYAIMRNVYVLVNSFCLKAV